MLTHFSAKLQSGEVSHKAALEAEIPVIGSPVSIRIFSANLLSPD